VWAFTIVEDTSEDSTVRFIMLNGGLYFGGGGTNSMGMIVLEVFNKEISCEDIVSKGCSEVRAGFKVGHE